MSQPLAPGTRLGVYEVLGQLGAGGMGEVYRARDTRLQREVAIKVLPRGLAATPEARARFDREARAISSLNHPNICTLHDVGHEGDVHYLVLELVSGESLADRVARGPLPVEEIVRIGSQIADALEKAHRAGIVHRDLKPGNVMLAKAGAKLLDFGLAQGGGTESAAESGSDSPTMSRPITKEGTIVGTFQYMAPEQLEGGRMDARTDVWALGCLLYEMATGKRAFQGKSQASLISAIMSQEPASMSQLSPLTPPALERLVKACLAKDPDERMQTAHDVKLQLQWIAEGGSRAGLAAPVVARRLTRERLKWALAVVSAAAITLLLRPSPPRRSTILELTPPSPVTFVDLPRLSPDGSLLAFNAVDSAGVASIWVRRMDSLEGKAIVSAPGASRPFWSPDGRYLAYFALGRLYKVGIAGGPPISISDAASGSDGTWSPRGVILFDGSVTDSIRMVPAAGGVPKGVSFIDRESETYHAWPQFLPDGKHFLYVAYGPANRRTLMVGSIDSKKTKALGPVASKVEYASGHVLSVRAGALIAQRLDPRGLKWAGDPFVVAQGVESDVGGGARFSAASNGTLVYRASTLGESMRMRWFNRRGEQVGTVGPAGEYDAPALSLDGTRLAVERFDAEQAIRELWIWDVERDLGTRFAFDEQNPEAPVWSPDGERLAYSRIGAGGVELVARAADGRGPASLLYSSVDQKRACSWSADGRWIAFMMRPSTVAQSFNVYALSPDGSSKPVPIVTTPFQDIHPAISPDGKWLAYSSLESGRSEVYVQRFPEPSERRRVSTRGGRQPFWRGDGHELFYLGLDRSLMSVAVADGPPARFSLPVKLFDAPVVPHLFPRNLYVPTRDGQRFLLLTSAGGGRVAATTVVLDWLAAHEKGAGRRSSNE